MEMLIEVGPGAVVSGLVRDSADGPVLALDAGGPSLKGLLEAVGAAFLAGAPVKHAALFADRFQRPFALDRKPMFFMNPCELAPVSLGVSGRDSTLKISDSGAKPPRWKGRTDRTGQTGQTGRT